MALFSRKKNAPAQIELKSSGCKNNLSFSDVLGFGYSAATPYSAMQFYKNSSAVSIPINLIADSFSSIDPVIKIGDEIERDHPILDILRTPNPDFTQESLFEKLGKDFLITGEAYIVAIGRIQSQPINIYAISPTDASVVEGAGGFAASFSISGSTFGGEYSRADFRKKVRYISQDKMKEIKQIRNYSTRNNSLLRGESLLVSVAKEVQQHISGNVHNIGLLENGGRVSMWFNTEDGLGVDDFEAMREGLTASFSGPTNAGKIAITAGTKMDVREFGTSNKDMDFASLQEMAKRSVALQYKVPLPLITTDATTFNNYAEAKLALFDDATLPLADRIFGGLTDLLVPRFGLDPSKVRITYDPESITALKVRQNEQLKLRKDLGIETINELRSSIGREEVQGGDSVLQPANLIPVGSDLFTDDNLKRPEIMAEDVD